MSEIKQASRLLSLWAVVVIASLSCQNKNQENNQAADTANVGTLESTSRQTKGDKTSFDVTSVPVSGENLGAFPFFNLPEGLKPLNKPVEKKFDRLFFPLNGTMTPIEGRVWRSFIEAGEGTGEWSLPYFQKSYDEAVTAAGGKKIFDGQITKEEFDRYNKQAPYLGDDGGMGYPEEHITVYLIRRPNGDDIYIQLTGNDAGGKLNILQKQPFKQTITIIKSDQIQKDLAEHGKAVLHINFDTDKATLRPDGGQAVAEVVKVLHQDNTLKIAINGYTDNAGTAAHNLELSKQRAAAVKDQITKAGIDEGRLTDDGFGQDNPVADNATEEGKAQNRRVELIKK